MTATTRCAMVAFEVGNFDGGWAEYGRQVAEQEARQLIDRTVATRNPFDAKYSKVEDADWETCSLVLEPRAVKEQLSRGW